MDINIDSQDKIYTQNLTNYSTWLRNMTPQYKHQPQVHTTPDKTYKHSQVINTYRNTQRKRYDYKFRDNNYEDSSFCALPQTLIARFVC